MVWIWNGIVNPNHLKSGQMGNFFQQTFEIRDGGGGSDRLMARRKKEFE